MPAVPLLSSTPVRDLEALEDSARLTIEGDISDTLLKGTRVEVLRVKMVHVVRLFVELVHVEVLNTDANFTGLLNVEPVGDESDVRVAELNEIADNGLELVARVEQNLDPADLALRAQVMLQRAIHLPFIEDGDVDSAVQKTSLELHHLCTLIFL